MCQHILILVKFTFSFLQCMYVITIFQEIELYSWLKSNYLVLAMHALHLFAKQVTGLFSSLIPGTHVRLLALKRLIYAFVGSRSVNYWVRYLSIIEVARDLSIEVTWWGWFCLRQSIRKWGIVSMFTMNFCLHKFLNVIGICIRYIWNICWLYMLLQSIYSLAEQDFDVYMDNLFKSHLFV